MSQDKSSIVVYSVEVKMLPFKRHVFSYLPSCKTGSKKRADRRCSFACGPLSALQPLSGMCPRIPHVSTSGQHPMKSKICQWFLASYWMSGSNLLALECVQDCTNVVYSLKEALNVMWLQVRRKKQNNASPLHRTGFTAIDNQQELIVALNNYV